MVAKDQSANLNLFARVCGLHNENNDCPLFALLSASILSPDVNS
jgi:hypothetical protein